MNRSRLSSLVLISLLAACGGSSSGSTEATTTSASAAASVAPTSGGEATSRVSAGTLTIAGVGLPRSIGGALSPDYADMTTWDPDQGRLVAYFGTGDQAFGVTLNLGAPFVVGARDVTTGPVVFEMGESFGQRVDVRDARVEVQAIDRAQRTIQLKIEGHTTVDSGGLPEAFAFEATLAVPAPAQ
ncbi:MAG: hypothetical protein U0230_23885 [Polyangiales bacterium]